jgi:molecular chaperone GrpE
MEQNINNEEKETQSSENTEKEEKELTPLEKELEEANKKAYDLEASLAAANDKYLRLMAEYDNFRKRSAKERDGIYHDAYADAVKQILPIIDNMERASTFAGDENLSKGVDMILASVTETLKKMGVTVIETKTFDPQLHNAVMHMEDENYAEGEIVEVFQKGYMLGDKVIRHAMVKVAN